MSETLFDCPHVAPPTLEKAKQLSTERIERMVAEINPTTTVWFSWREADLAIAAGARSGETTEELARSEGRQSGGTKIPHRPENSNSTQKACE